MKRLITTFLKVGFILSVVFAAYGLVSMSIGIITLIFMDPPLYSLISSGLYMLIVGLFSTIVLAKIRTIWPTITKKEDAKVIAIWAIVVGALLTGFPIASGVLMLVMPADRYSKSE